jgi:hypothetical protein
MGKLYGYTSYEHLYKHRGTGWEVPLDEWYWSEVCLRYLHRIGETGESHWHCFLVCEIFSDWVLLFFEIWGELVVCDADFGICSNGQVVFLYIRTDTNQLTCSTVENITSAGVLETLFGFTCASIDAFLAQTPQQNKAVIDLLAPPGKRHSNWARTTSNPRHM